MEALYGVVPDKASITLHLRLSARSTAPAAAIQNMYIGPALRALMYLMYRYFVRFSLMLHMLDPYFPLLSNM